MFQFLIDEYVHKRDKTLGLLVDKDNPDAKKLYLKLGFEIVGEKTLVGKNMEHLQFKK
jgi:ribosomal protein S18 acetylase RimI-like enzyme